MARHVPRPQVQVQTLTWRMPGGPLRLLRGHPEAVSEAFNALLAAGATEVEIASETGAESLRVQR